MTAAVASGGPVKVIPVVTYEEFLDEFAAVMREWGHYRTAAGLRFPDLDEARRAAAGRRADRGWNTAPLP